MADASVPAASLPPPPTRPPGATALVVLAVSGGIGLALGLLGSFSSLGGSDPTGPRVVALLGAGALVAAVVLPWLVRLSVVPLPIPPPPGAYGLATPCPTCEARERHASIWAAFEASAHPPAPVRAAARVGLPLLAHGSTTGDALWSAWTPASGELPVSLVGPVPETAYVPPREDAPEVFAERTPSLFVDLRSGEILVPSSLAAPAGFDPTPTPGPGPYDRATGAPFPVAPRPIGPSRLSATTFVPDELPGMAPEDEEWTATQPISAGPPAGLPERIRWEAVTAVPPHLRPRAPVPPRRPPTAPSVAAARPTRAWCATCREPIEAPVAWRRCHDCARPLCHACVVTALVEEERAWCSACAAEHGASSPVLETGS